MNPEQEYPFTQDTYQTGSTQPPKSHNGVIAFLLVLVIFLCGLTTALGLMNIRLLDALKSEKQETAPVAFSGAQDAQAAEDVYFSLGFSGLEVPEIWSLYQDLPLGIYVTDVKETSDAAAKGVLPGDILVQVDGQEVTAAQQLSTLLENRQSPAKVVLYRNGKNIEMTLSLFVIDN